ncbi:MAG: arsenic transporter [Bryobacterales bacterium]|nr:arsenic transporter [Bryobacterales bacterium]MBV9396778.1 arsenic transporter [Bryobacterales bacterium]
MQVLTSPQTVLVWAIAAAAIAGVIFRPRKWPEAVWACAGAALLVLFGSVSPMSAIGAIGKGTNVYLFLTGMMLLAELARLKGVFDWLAALAVRASKGSHARLFTLVYCVGVLVTVFLSNDATAVVLTPAVYAAVKRARAHPLTYLFICAFVANAASFVLPISNPANLIVYGKTLPPLGPWLRTFLLPSIFSIAATYAALRWASRGNVSGTVNDRSCSTTQILSVEGKRAASGIAASAVALILASAFGLNLGLPACAVAIVSVLIATRFRWSALRDVTAGVAWSVLPLVAGLFILVEGLNRAGSLAAISHSLRVFESMPRPTGELAAAFGIAALSNLVNNLPAGLLAGSAIQAVQIAPRIRDSVLIGVNLGPNLSVTGSLATVLWLIALRREGVEMSPWQFLKLGATVMPPALILATLALSWAAR